MRAAILDQRITSVSYNWDGEDNASPSVQQVNGAAVCRNMANNPRFTRTSGTAEVRRNLFANPRGKNGNGWGPHRGIGGESTSNTDESITDHPLGITTAIKTVWSTGSTSTSGGLYLGLSAINLSLTAGTTYTFSCWVKTSVNQVIRMSAEWKDAGGAAINTVAGNNFSIHANVWTRISLIGVVAPVNTAFANITMYVRPGGVNWSPGDTMWATGVLAEATTILRPYFDGSYSPDPDLTPVWVGTANASQSYLRGFVPANTGVSNNNFTVASQNNRMRLIPNKPEANNSNTGAGGASSSLSGNGVTFTPGKWYGFQAVCTLLAPQTGSIGSSARIIQLTFNNVNGWTGSRNVFSSQPPNKAGSYQEELVTQLPADSVWASLYLCNGASFGNGDVYWDKLLIVEGDTEEEVRRKLAQGYFDGDTQVNAETINGVKL